MKKLKLFAKNFQKIGKIFQKIIKKYTFFEKFIKKIAKLAKNFGYCTKNTIQNIFFTSMRYFFTHFAEVLKMYFANFCLSFCCFKFVLVGIFLKTKIFL